MPTDKNIHRAKKPTAAAVGALESYKKAKDVTSDEPKQGKNASATKGGVVKASKQQYKRHPRVWFMGHKVAVCEGQEELAKAALKKARDADTIWTDKAWKAVMKTVLKQI